MPRKFEIGARVKVLDTFYGNSIRGYIGTIKSAVGESWDVMIDDDPDDNPDTPWTIRESDMTLWYPEDEPLADTEKVVTLDREFLREVLDELPPGSDIWERLDKRVNEPVTQKFEVTVTHVDPLKYLQNMLPGDGVQIEISRIEG